MSGHLLHIGYPKAGSKYLQRWFAAHPQLAYRDGGIAGFNDVYAMITHAADAGDEPLYRVTSSEGLSAPHLDSGHDLVEYARTRPTSTVTAQLKACTMLAELFPNAVVLIVTRGYRSMVLSSYSQFVRSGGFVDLADLVAVARTKSGPEFDRLADLAPWDYDQLIGAYARAFGADHVVVMPYELLRDDAATFTRTLAERLGIEPFAADFGRINESLSPAEMYWYPRFTRLVRALRSRRLVERFASLSFTNRLRRPVALLEKLWPGKAVTGAMIADDVLEPFRGRAERLRENPLYAAYEKEYLLG